LILFTQDLSKWAGISVHPFKSVWLTLDLLDDAALHTFAAGSFELLAPIRWGSYGG
jgi:hypothetical protein